MQDDTITAASCLYSAAEHANKIVSVVDCKGCRVDKDLNWFLDDLFAGFPTETVSKGYYALRVTAQTSSLVQTSQTTSSTKKDSVGGGATTTSQTVTQIERSAVFSSNPTKSFHSAFRFYEASSCNATGCTSQLTPANLYNSLAYTSGGTIRAPFSTSPNSQTISKDIQLGSTDCKPQAVPQATSFKLAYKYADSAVDFTPLTGQAPAPYQAKTLDINGCFTDDGRKKNIAVVESNNFAQSFTVPDVGILKICFSGKKLPTKVSAMGLVKTSGNQGSFEVYKSELGFLCTAKSQSPVTNKDGAESCSKDCQYDALRATLAFMIWIGRLGTFLGMWAGLSCLTQPVSVVPDLIPFIGPCIGDLTGSLLCCFDCMIACQCWLCFTAIMYVLYRPVIGAPLVCIAVGLALATAYMRKEHGRPYPQGAPGGEVPTQQPMTGGGIQMAQPMM
eukprot:g3885.t1